MTILSVIGLLVLVMGVFLIGVGFKGTQRLSDKIVEGVTGHYRSRTMWYLIGGVVLLLLGLALIFMGWHTPLITHP